MKSIVVHSGGMDSSVLLYQLVQNGDEVKTISIDYGQRHKKEILQAKKMAESLGIEHQIADLTSITHLLSGSALTSPDIEVPEGHYAEAMMIWHVIVDELAPGNSSQIRCLISE